MMSGISKQCSCFLFLWSGNVSELTVVAAAVVAAARVAVGSTGEILQEQRRDAECGCCGSLLFGSVP